MKTILYLQNLKCGGCVASITKGIHRISGIEVIRVFPAKAALEITYVSEGQLDQVKEMLNTMGYPIQGEENPFSKKAKSYVSCALGKMKG